MSLHPTLQQLLNESHELRAERSTSRSRLERIPVSIFDEHEAMALSVAERIRELVESRRAEGRNAVLGLPTGSTPLGVYRHLVRMHREGLDLSNVVCFNLDEYHPIAPTALQSYHRYMRENLFDHVNIPEEQIFIPRGNLPIDEVPAFCRRYEEHIQEAGGMDLLLLGIGRTGHIGFNEPGSAVVSRTRLVALDDVTRKDAAQDFFGDMSVPSYAISMGVATILEAREIILLATGEHKAAIVRRAVEEEPTREVSATFLQLHNNTNFFVDRAAASSLTREAKPWLVGKVDWEPELVKKAVVWLSQEEGRSLSRLSAEDFRRNGLQGVLAGRRSLDGLTRGIADELSGRVMKDHQVPTGRKVLVLSPHPDDDVISMGGTLRKFAEAGNHVEVAYMTSGSIAVFDSDVRKYIRFLLRSGGDVARYEALLDALNAKLPGESDSPEILALKANIRAAEALAALEEVGIDPSRGRFMDLPFYRTGTTAKRPVSQEDVDIVLETFRQVRPEVVFVAGDLSDPHGTHRMCYQATAEALRTYRAELSGEPPQVWLYRGAWQEWEIERAHVFVPLSRTELDKKIDAIFRHESQKDRAMFPGSVDSREFWQRARDRNVNTAEELRQLGLADLFAAEAFVVTEEL